MASLPPYSGTSGREAEKAPETGPLPIKMRGGVVRNLQTDRLPEPGDAPGAYDSEFRLIFHKFFLALWKR